MQEHEELLKECKNVESLLGRKKEDDEKGYADRTIETLRDANWEMLDSVKNEVSEEDMKRATYVLGEKDRVLAVCEALNAGDYEKVGQMMYETHNGLSKDYEVSCEELDFLVEIARKNGVTGSRIMGGGFGGCTINLVKDELYDRFINDAVAEYKEKFNKQLKIYNVVISDGAHKVC